MSLIFLSLTMSLILLMPFPTLSLSSNNTPPPCPFDDTVLPSRPSLDAATRCRYLLHALGFFQTTHLRRTGFFLPPPNSSSSSFSFSCWNSLHSSINQYDIRFSCNISSSSLSEGCMNITTLQQFHALAPLAALQDVHTYCNQSLENVAPCALCSTPMSKLALNFTGSSSTANVADCSAIVSIYAASLLDHFDPGSAECLFKAHFGGSTSKKRKIVIVVGSVFGVLVLLLLIGGFWGYFRLKQKKDILRKEEDTGGTEMGLVLMNRSISTTTTPLITFNFDDIKKATGNFSTQNIIGRGSYGNVFKGVLSDGSQVAVKRFKNCSVAGDASFTHEVEVIASVRHVNLVALRGYCAAATHFEGHQRIIITDLMKNGSLYDHLFGSSKKKLSWPIRQKIAAGTARGLAYLHYGAQPSIIHRDIKASNILLDDKFEAKVADFGLAKFYDPEGMTHVSTRVAGTMGYVAPEYALYGQLTERSDVFSFGVVLLELLSGKKALQMNGDGQPSALTDLAWSLVRNGRALDVIEAGLPEPGAPQDLEKYVLVAVLCCHPQLYARPTMDQVVKMLETDESVPSIMERPIPSFLGGLILRNLPVSVANRISSAFQL